MALLVHPAADNIATEYIAPDNIAADNIAADNIAADNIAADIHCSRQHCTHARTRLPWRLQVMAAVPYIQCWDSDMHTGLVVASVAAIIVCA